MDKVTELALKQLGKKIEDLTNRTEIIELNLGLGKIDHLPQEKEVEGKVIYRWGRGSAAGATEEWARIQVPKKEYDCSKCIYDGSTTLGTCPAMCEPIKHCNFYKPKQPTKESQEKEASICDTHLRDGCKLYEPTKEVPDIPSVEEIERLIHNFLMTEYLISDKDNASLRTHQARLIDMKKYLAQEISALYRKENGK